MKRATKLLSGLICVALCMKSAAYAAPRALIPSQTTTIDIPGQAGGTAVNAINDAGDITGYYVDSARADHGFISIKRVIHPLDDPDSYTGTRPTGISSRDDVVGTFESKNGLTHGFVWHDGAFTTLDAPGAAGGTFPSAINSSGRIVGWFVNADLRVQSFLYFAGKFETLAPKPFVRGNWATGINDSGQIVGAGGLSNGRIFGFLMMGSQTVVLHGPKKCIQFEPITVNSSGEILGQVVSGSTGFAPYFRSKAGDYSEVSRSIGLPLYILSGMNNRGQCVGVEANPRLSGFVSVDGHGEKPAEYHFAPFNATTQAPKPILVLREGPDASIPLFNTPAKFALYDDGSVYLDVNNELAADFDQPKYFVEKLSAIDVTNLLSSLGVKSVLGTYDTNYGTKVGDVWHLLYWSASGERSSITVGGTLKNAPDSVSRLIYALEQYPTPLKRYTNYEYQASFSRNAHPVALPWPHFDDVVHIPNEVLVGGGAQGTMPDSAINYHDATQLIELLKRAHSDSVVINGVSWKIELDARAQLPNEAMWDEVGGF